MPTEASFENQLQLPILRTVNGEEVQFPRLELEDLIPWANDVKKQMRTEYDAQLREDKTLGPIDRHRLLSEQSYKGVSLNLLANRAEEPTGVQTVCSKSLAKAKKTNEQIVAILKQIHWIDKLELAREIMSPPRPADPPAQKEGSEDPLAGSTTGAPPSP